MICDNCGKTDADTVAEKQPRQLIRIVVFGHDDAFEREFCSVKCMKEYIEDWDEHIFIIWP